MLRAELREYLVSRVLLVARMSVFQVLVELRLVQSDRNLLSVHSCCLYFGTRLERSLSTKQHLGESDKFVGLKDSSFEFVFDCNIYSYPNKTPVGMRLSMILSSEDRP